METKFQTSFIPKRPLIPNNGINPTATPRRGGSLFMIIAVILFVASLAVGGGSYFYKSYVESAQLDYKAQLTQRERQFNPNRIEDLKRQNVKLDTAKQLLAEHVAVSQIFDVIGRFTIDNVRFTSMDVALDLQKKSDATINLKGYGTSLSAVAWQSDVLGKLERYGLRNIVKNPILSDPALDSNGLVAFSLSATVDRNSLLYDRTLSTPAATSTTP